MTFAHLIDLLTASSSLGVKFIGFPSQVRAGQKAWRAAAPSGLVWKLAIAMCVSYLMWVVHGLVHHDPVEIISQGAGAVLTGILTVQAIACDWRAQVPAGDSENTTLDA